MVEYERIRISQPNTDICVRSLSQTTGIGRSGQRWCSPRGGLWFTFALHHEETVDSFALFAGHVAQASKSTLRDLRAQHQVDKRHYFQDKKLAGFCVDIICG